MTPVYLENNAIIEIPCLNVVMEGLIIGLC
jgi:hypothetical protein